MLFSFLEWSKVPSVLSLNIVNMEVFMVRNNIIKLSPIEIEINTSMKKLFTFQSPRFIWLLTALLHKTELGEKLIKKIIKGTAAGMEHLHQEGIIHRGNKCE